jgi:lipid-binding SYLF domain-containing protein
MRHSLQRRTIVALGFAIALLQGCAADTPRSADDRLQRAEATLADFRKDPEMAWFRNNVKNARAVIISPRVTRVGFLVGGSGGEAVVMAKDKISANWAGPAFYNMGTASVGLLAGVDVSEIVVLVMTEKALDALMSNSFKVGADASVSAGPVGVGASGTINADMVAFSRSKGVFGGLSLDGAVITPDNGANAAYYAGAATPADILIRRAVTSPASVPMQQAIAAAAR